MDKSASVRLVHESEREFRTVLRLIVSGRSAPDGDADRRVDDLIRLMRSRSLAADLVFGAFSQERLVSACLAIELPGRSVVVQLPPDRVVERQPAPTVTLLRSVQAAAWARSAALVQAVVAPGNAAAETALSEAGFRFLAELIYQDSRVQDLPELPVVRKDLSFTTYSAQTHALFVQALDDSYAGSLDCPLLTGLRDTEDVLAAHEATGAHDPQMWFVAMRDSQAVGVVLLSQVLGRAALELVYMGVRADSRRTGVGDALLARALEECRRARATHLTLAVDSANTPAMRLYRRWGFTETARRRAWIAAASAERERLEK